MLEDLALDSAPQEASQEDQAALAHLEDLEDEADLLVAHVSIHWKGVEHLC